MLRKLLLTACLALAANALLFAQSGTLQGKITDKETKEPIPFANIVLESGGRQIGGATSDFDGKYTIKPLPPGKYNLKATYVGYKPLTVTNIVINSDKITFYDIAIVSTATTLDVVEVVDYKVPLISADKTSTGGTVTSEEIAKMPNRSANAVATTVGGVFSADGERGSVRGARTEGTTMYIDGIKVVGSSSLPQAAIEEVTVITGGLPARYGDAVGGVINVTTKGPSRSFGGGIELQTSQFLDAYGYNRLGFNVQGPLLKSKDETNPVSLLGYFIAGDLLYRQDGRPSNIGHLKVKDDVLADLIETPLRASGTGSGSLLSSEFVTRDQIEDIKASENTEFFQGNVSAKIDVRTTPTINLSFGGSLNYSNYDAYNWTRSLFNYENNPQVIESTWRVFGRFTQRFPNPVVKEGEKEPLIKNVYYTLQADYSKYNQIVQDRDHKDNLFNYGYVGKFKTHKARSYEIGSDSTLGYNDVYIHNGFADTLFSFDPSTINSEVARYTSMYYDLYDDPFLHYQNYTQVQLGGGLLNGDQPESVYGLWQNVGQQYNGYTSVDNTQIGIAAHGSADIGNHEIQFGIQYEQRSNSYYGYAPIGLWTLARSLANAHIVQLDKDNPIAVFDDFGVFQDTIYYERLYDGNAQFFFDYNLRDRLDLPTDGLDWVDVDNYDPEIFSIDMFSADELYRGGVNSLISYYGYDYTGNKLSGRPAFEDFFNATDDFGNNLRTIGAFEPIYLAGYIQDKFAFRDLIFNVGLRLDRYDANQMVLKDPYLLFEAKTVGEVDNLGTHPENIGQDYVVYVNDVNNPTSITGYRSGSVWYNSEGKEITDPSILDAGQGVSPFLVDPSAELNATAFKDYEPQTNLMPRISFSFPISDEALFFAHYDVLTQRPTGFSRMDPTDYLFMEARSGYINNPNLKPSRTIDYELGFMQKVSNTSSLNLSTFYREMRDQIQAYRFSGAYPQSYYSYNNIDFGTVKGLTITYDMRRTNNARIRASYTLQFAEGTGSDAESARALVSSNQPNLRTLSPLDYDRRHGINILLDYRYGEGKDYNGPVSSKKVKGSDQVKTVQWLKNTGFTLTFNGGSGTPYSRSSRVVATQLGGGSALLQGSVNGSRLPWQFRMDLRIDKDVILTAGSGDDGKKLFMNIFLDVLNVLNTKNILSVYRATGNADDDGYLAAAEFQAGIQAQTYEQAFRDLYALKVNNPANYSAPRQIRLGVSLNF